VTLCEFRYESFDARGSGEHLDRVAALLDDLLEARWVLTDATRDAAGGGWWRICLYREMGTGRKKRTVHGSE
jgi:hypothetical protein